MITGDKIILRPIRIEDGEYTVRWRNDLFLKASTMSHPFPVTDDMEKWYEQNSKEQEQQLSPVHCCVEEQ